MGLGSKNIPATEGTQILIKSDVEKIANNLSTVVNLSELITKMDNIKSILEGKTTELTSSLSNIKLDTIINNQLNGDVVTKIQSTNLGVSVTDVSGNGVIAIIPAVYNKYHIISYIGITLYNTDNKSGTSFPPIVTTSNLSGNIEFTFGTHGTKGSVDRLLLSPVMPIKSTVAGQPTTITCPPTPDVIWRVNILYTISV